MSVIRCGKESCVHRYNGRCELTYIFLQSETTGPLLKCGGFEMDREYEETLNLIGGNPKLSREKVREEH